VGRVRGIRVRALVLASGGPRYAVAIAVDAVGSGLLRPFMLLYGINVLRLPSTTAGLAMTAGVVAGLSCAPPMGRWLDRGARSAAVAAAMLVRVIGTALLLLAPADGPGALWLFAAAALFLGLGNQAFPVAHAALVATFSHGRDRDAALAAARSLRNAGLGIGALLATAALTGGTPALRALAACTGLSYLLSAALAWSVHVRASPRARSARPGGQGPCLPAAAPPRMRLLLAANVIYVFCLNVPEVALPLAANVIYVFCLNVPEVALPLVLVTQLHAPPEWAAGVFVANTVLVVALQVPVTVWMSRFSRRIALAISGIVLSVSYLGFLAGIELGHGGAAPALFGVSLLCTIGEIIYAGSSTALVAATAPPEVLGRALARFQLSTGFGLAVSPAVITALAANGPGALWASLAAATLLSGAAVTHAKVAMDIYRFLADAERAQIVKDVTKRLGHPWPDTAPDLDAAARPFHATIVPDVLTEKGYMTTPRRPGPSNRRAIRLPPPSAQSRPKGHPGEDPSRINC
jgi:MFS family permease